MNLSLNFSLLNFLNPTFHPAFVNNFSSIRYLNASLPICLFSPALKRDAVQRGPRLSAYYSMLTFWILAIAGCHSFMWSIWKLFLQFRLFPVQFTPHYFIVLRRWNPCGVHGHGCPHPAFNRTDRRPLSEPKHVGRLNYHFMSRSALICSFHHDFIWIFKCCRR